MNKKLIHSIILKTPLNIDTLSAYNAQRLYDIKILVDDLTVQLSFTEAEIIAENIYINMPESRKKTIDLRI
jgi:hypothetical protein